MRQIRLAAVILLAVGFGAPRLCLAEGAERPYRGVVYEHDVRQDPPENLFAVIIDLEAARAQVDVAPGGPDPDGDGKWQTVLVPVPKIAANQGFDIAVNGDFFAHLSGKDAEGAAALKEFKGGTPATVSGPAVSDGHQWAQSATTRPTLVVSKEGRVAICDTRELPPDTEEAIAGSHMLVKDGKNVATPKGSLSTTRHPRTAVGVRDHGKQLVLLVVDGRKKGVSAGMTFQELADEMVKLGCDDAINLDGGGSSCLVLRNPKTGELEVKNTPSDGRPRPVANALGITLNKAAPGNGR